MSTIVIVGEIKKDLIELINQMKGLEENYRTLVITTLQQGHTIDEAAEWIAKAAQQEGIVYALENVKLEFDGIESINTAEEDLVAGLLLSFEELAREYEADKKIPFERKYPYKGKPFSIELALYENRVKGLDVVIGVLRKWVLCISRIRDSTETEN